MTTFWWVISGLLLLSVLMVVIPVIFWQCRQSLMPDENSQSVNTKSLREQQNLTIFQQNKQELDRQLSDKTIGQRDYDLLVVEMQRNLLIDIPEDDQPNAVATVPSPGKIYSVVLLLAVLIPVSSLYLYEQWGAEDRVAQLELVQQTLTKQGGRSKTDFIRMADDLENKLRDQPDDIRGRMLLAKTRMSLQQYTQAAEIYKNLIDKADTDKNRAMAMGLYAQASFFIAGQKITPEILNTIGLALQADPDEVTSLSLTGVDAFARENYPLAAESWQRAAENTDNPQNRETLLRGVDQARQHMGLPPQISPSKSGGASDGTAENFGSLLVDLSIKPELLNGLDPDLRVYLFAKAVNGPRAPLAANRYKLSELPLRVALDDSMAMNPELKLSMFARVEIVARVSLNGKPMASKGDLQGSVTLTRKGSSQTGIGLVIDSVVR
ncbi:MAG: c-type cytochrome biogenesis protein CcmI [Pseudomonadales bacterium]|nr:c-type cytochrome biogenesis protein CcmI [Pseudomonadales bacterium]